MGLYNCIGMFEITHIDNRIRASYMNLIKGTLHGKKKHRRLHGLAPKGTVVNTTLLPKSATMLFEEYDIYDFLESLYPHRSLPKKPIVGNVNKNIYSTDSCTIESIHFDTNKYTVVFKCGNKILNPFEEYELGCVPVLNIVCNYLKDKIPTDILVEHFGNRVNRIITKFKIQNFISYLLSKKNDHDADYWGIVQNEEKNIRYHFTSIRMAIIKNQEMLAGIWKDSFWVWWECEQLLWKAVWQFLKKI